MKLNLQRPIVFFDLETTGLNPSEDRIIEICCIKLHPDGKRDIKTRRVNPEKEISSEASEITGITDDDVKDEPTFKQMAKGIYNFFENCDISGYNIMRFDLRVLTEEFKRAGISFDASAHQLVDVQRIFHKKEPRTLEAALRFYCKKDLEGAHAAENDVIATIDVLEGQLDMYDDIENDITQLAEYCKDERWVDMNGRLHWKGEDASIGFGKNQGKLLKDLVKTDRGYLDWILRGEFPEDTKRIIQNAIKNGIYPSKKELEVK
jgi:DNA polymerase III subunit epsilon